MRFLSLFFNIAKKKSGFFFLIFKQIDSKYKSLDYAGLRVRNKYDY